MALDVVVLAAVVATASNTIAMEDFEGNKTHGPCPQSHHTKQRDAIAANGNVNMTLGHISSIYYKFFVYTRSQMHSKFKLQMSSRGNEHIEEATTLI
jgi:hypothetical protein